MRALKRPVLSLVAGLCVAACTIRPYDTSLGERDAEADPGLGGTTGDPSTGGTSGTNTGGSTASNSGGTATSGGSAGTGGTTNAGGTTSAGGTGGTGGAAPTCSTAALRLSPGPRLLQDFEELTLGAVHSLDSPTFPVFTFQDVARFAYFGYGGTETKPAYLTVIAGTVSPHAISLVIPATTWGGHMVFASHCFDTSWYDVPLDLTAFSGIKFHARTSNVTQAALVVMFPPEAVGCDTHPNGILSASEGRFPPSSEWTERSVMWADLDDFFCPDDTKIGSANMARVVRIAFGVIGTTPNAVLDIDDVEFLP